MLQLRSVVIEQGGRVLFEPLNFTFDPSRRLGLVGASGVGKTSLARVLAGFAEPQAGQVSGVEGVRYFAQFADRPTGTVEEFLAELWTTGAPAHPLWHRWVPAGPEPERSLASLSGGEWMRLRLLTLLEDAAEFVILDEPTNHLDRAGRTAVAEFVRGRAGAIVISHDRELLRMVDEIAELTSHGFQRFGGGFDFFWAERARQRERQADAVEMARRERRQEKAAAIARVAAQEKRSRQAERKSAEGGLPRIVRNALKRRAQVTQGKLVRHGVEAVAEADAKWREAVAARQEDPFLRLDFAAAAPPAGAVHFAAEELQVRFENGVELWAQPLVFVLSGRERWRVSGPNGSGKSTLLRLFRGESVASISGRLRVSGRPSVYLDQGQGFLKDEQSVFALAAADSRFKPVALRNELAFFGFTGARADQRIATLSGGERLRAALAVMFLSREIPQVVLLDEPTNNLDFQSQELLLAALRRFEGLLVVASHDEAFVEQLELTHELRLR